MKTKERALRATKPRAPMAGVGPGLHLAHVELSAGGSYQVREASGERRSVTLGEGVDPELANACLRTARPVVLADTPAGVAIVGALVTSLPVERDADGRLSVDAREIRLRAPEGVSIEVGDLRVAASPGGALRLEGDRMVIDMSALVRVLSTRVELP